MDKACVICGKPSTYKCPRCLVNYCSANCCKEHRKAACEDTSTCNKSIDDKKHEENNTDLENNSTVSQELLKLLGKDEELKKLLANKHLRKMLSMIDKAENVEEIMHQAMQEPIFVEFADACLRVVDPDKEDED